MILGCEIDEKCSSGSIPYKVISGEGTQKLPMICFNNKLYANSKYELKYFELILFRLVHENLKDSRIGRGVNLVVLDSRTYDIKLSETFDTYLEGRIRIIMLMVKGILMISF